MADPDPHAPSGSAEAGPQRPRVIPLILTWDLVLAVFLLFQAVAAFSGGIQIGSRSVELPVAVQIGTALTTAGGGAAFVLVGIALVRQQAWVRRAQVALLLAAAAISVLSYLAIQLLQHQGLDAATLLSQTLGALIDLLAVMAMTGRRMAGWYRESGPVPVYVGALIAVWIAWSVAYVVVASRA